MNLALDIILWITYLISLYFSIFLVLIFIDKRSLFREEKSSLTLSTYPLVSILIPAYNEEKTIIKTLESVYHLEYPLEKLDILIIDDGSTDKTGSLVKDYIQDKSQFTLISHPNCGKAASLNKARARAQGEFFSCLDADSFVDPWTLKKMLAFYYAQNDPALVIITPAMKVYNPTTVLEKIQWLEYIVIILVARLSSHLDSLYVAPGPFSLYRTQIINNLGGFDEHTLTEDQEIAYRVQQHQYKIKQCFDGYVYTTAPKKIPSFYRQRRRWYLGSLACLYKYKNMVANRKYGDFGVMQLTKNVTGYTLAIVGMIAAVYLLFLPLISKVRNLFLIRFDIIPYFAHLQVIPSWLNVLASGFRQSFILILLFLLTIFFLYQAHKNAQEKISKLGWIPLFPYLLFYYLLKGCILLLSLAEFSRRKKIRW